MKMDASGNRTSGSINRMTMPRLNGFTTSKPRTWRIVAIAELISSLLLHLIPPHAVNNFRVCAIPAAEKLADGEGHLDVRERRVRVVELVVRDGAEVVLDERLLRL